MIKNYLKTAWRNLAQNGITSVISVAGLSLGIACFLLLTTYIINELRYDRFNVNAAQIVRLTNTSKAPNDAEPGTTALTPTAPVPMLTQAFPDIANGVRVYNYTGYKPATVQYNDKVFAESKMLVADESFFNIFSFKFLKGDPKTALNRIESVVITQKIAQKYFGNANPIGKVLKINTTRNMLVTGVIEEVPEYSQIKFDLMGTYAMLDRSKTRRWDSSNDYSYLLLKPGANVQQLEKNINTYADNQRKSDAKAGYLSHYNLEPLTSVHLYSKAKNPLEPSGNIKYVYILGFISIVLLVLACINFLNLVTARSMERAHEIGVRKVMGALRGQLFAQFITEAAIITAAALIGGVLLAIAGFNWFSNFSGSQLGFQTWNLTWLVSAIAALFVLVTFLAGTYPSLYLSAFKPIVTLRGRSTGSSGGALLRKSLVVFQFAVSVFFIISTIIAGNQLHFIQKMDTGINRDNVMVLDIGGMAFKNISAFRGALLQQQGIKNISASYDSPVNIRGGYSISTDDAPSGHINLSVTAIPVERNFTNVLGIKLIAGNNFSNTDEQQVLDTNSNNRHYSFIINEMTAKALGFSPQQAIGKRLTMGGRKGEICGVARNFNFASLHTEISPVVLFPEYDYFGKLLIKTSGNDVAATISHIGDTWKSFYPNSALELHFLDQEYKNLYKSEQRIGGILTVFTMVTIFISCLGLFGLAVFSTRQRVREVGIRKVMGATVGNIAALISGEFLKLVLIVIVIASPVAYYVMNKWLQDFVYRMHIQVWVFIAAAAVAIVIAFLTVGFQSVKAAMANPVKSLRSE